MNITTSTLLNILSPSLNNTIKDKIEKLSVDGKVDIPTLIKGKSVQILISGLFKDISSEVKTKEAVSTLLNNNKNSFSFKNLSSDIKSLVKFLQTQSSLIGSTKSDIKTDVRNEVKLLNQITILKESIVDIKNIDAKVLKENISNSGVFLESKLAKNSIPISTTIEKLLSLVKDQIGMIQQAPNTKVNEKIQIQSQLLSKANIPSDLKLEIKNAIANILKDIKQIQVQIKPKLEKQLELLKNVEYNIKNLTAKIDNAGIKNDIPNNLKELFGNIKDQLSNNNTKDIKQLVSQITDKLNNVKVELPASIKSDIQNISSSIKTLETIKNPEQQQLVLKDLTQNIKNFESKLMTFNTRVLLENNTSIPKNLSSDLKTVILQISEQIETSKDVVSKEIKATVEKIQSQIEFFQLLSYSSNSNHTYLSFLQENIEDADIKFNSTGDDSVSCQINLILKKQGELKVLLVLDKKQNLNINIGIENIDFKEKIQGSLQKLRAGINNIGLMLQSLNVFDINENSSSKSIGGYGSDDSINFGLDIRA